MAVPAHLLDNAGVRGDPISRRLRSYFDELAGGEWTRLEQSPAGVVSHAVHRRFLEDHVRAGDRVLEIGAGPGRFTLELARLGARVVVTDVSPVQLELNVATMRRHDAEHSVEDRHLLDVRDAVSAGLGDFDVVTAFGGPLSYVFEDAADALTGLLDLVAPGRPVLASVMSLLGSWRALLGPSLEQADEVGDRVMAELLRTGDLRPAQPTGHVCQLYRWSGVGALVESCGAAVISASASNWASLGDPSAVARIASNPARWGYFIDQEIAMCREPGALDGGTHILFAAVRNGPANESPSE